MRMIRLPKSFPASDYTPHGFGYWLSELEGAYAGGQRGHVNYLALLQTTKLIDVAKVEW